MSGVSKHVVNVNSSNSAFTVRTSKSHPLNISWLLPQSMLMINNNKQPAKRSVSIYLDQQEGQTELKRSGSSGGGQGRKKTLEKRTSEDLDRDETEEDEGQGAKGVIIKFGREETGLNRDPFVMRTLQTTDGELRRLVASEKKSMGNLALSSLPGKKVRLDVKDQSLIRRSPKARDLDSDFSRIRDHGIKVVINLLDDSELNLLSTPWEEYQAKAEKYGLGVIRFPIGEGNCPDDMEQFEAKVIKPLQELTQDKGFHVLVHCRGGIGRAGLVACCWLLKNGFCSSPLKAIKYVRIRRSIKAIETSLQEDFIHRYAGFLTSTSTTNK